MKIIIIGNGGTGKSTLGKELSVILGIGVFHLDRITFKTNWTQVEENIFRQNLAGILCLEKWIIEGWSYQSTLKERLELSDIIIYLKFSIYSCYFGAIKRHILYMFRQNPFDPPGSRVWRKTIKMIKAMWRVYKKYEPELQIMLEEYKKRKTIYIFESRKQLNSNKKQLVGLLKNQRKKICHA